MNAIDTARPPCENPQAFGVYIHFPYCERICSYCDFVVTAATEIPHKVYADAVLQEFHHRAPRFEGMELATLYFGGGTPSLWAPEQVKRVIHEIVERYGGDHLQEVTLEANPAQTLHADLDAFAKAGVNRISLGVQSLNDATLRTLRRTHTAAQALADLERVLAHPAFPQVTGDLIYGLPGSSVASAVEETQTLCDLGLSHLSLYALTLEEGTPLTRSVTRKTLSVPNNDAVADQAEAVWEVAEKAGLKHYEVSSVARTGCEAKHNSLYWHLRGYLGLGVGAHGLERVSPSSRNPYARWAYRENSDHLETYLGNPTASGTETVHDRISWLRDLLIVRPRWLRGFLEDEIYAHTTDDEQRQIQMEIELLARENLFTRDGANLRLTREGVLFADSITERLAAPVASNNSN